MPNTTYDLNQFTLYRIPQTARISQKIRNKQVWFIGEYREFPMESGVFAHFRVAGTDDYIWLRPHVVVKDN